MNEYINRDDLMELVGRWKLDTREAIAEMIMSVPSADVVERKTAHWESIDDIIWICSECKYVDGRRRNYCPNCGAEMKQE